jgi:calcineurin-like phosphoesterase family protein
MDELSRRDVLKAGAAAAGVIVAQDVWPGAARAEDAARPNFTFAVLNDTHYNDERCGPYFESLVKKINASGVELVLIAGDLSQSGTKEQLNAFREILGKLKPPLYAVPGNHDFRNDVNPADPAGERLNVDRTTYDAAFPKMVNYCFEHNGWQVVALDTCDGVKWQGVKAGKDMFDWLDGAAKKLDRKKPTVLATHFPLGKQDDRGYPGNVLANADDVLARFKDLNLRAVFNGHHHGLTEQKIAGVPVLTGTACSFFIANHDGTKKKGYFLATCRDGALAYEFVDATPEARQEKSEPPAR